MALSLPPHFAKAIRERGDWSFQLRSPGRINIIGEHTDYNGGLVLPAAIQQGIYFAVRPSRDGKYRFTALDISEEKSVARLPAQRTGTNWFDYLVGVAQQFSQRGHHIPPVEIVFGGDLPIGAGVSSSAALEGGMAFICNHLTEANFSRPQLALICHASSNDFMGIPSGIMDQFASLNGRKDQAILLDCSNLKHEYVAAEIPGYRFVLVNSMVTHALAASAYVTRVAECQAGLTLIKARYAEVKSLAQATPEQVERLKAEMPENVYRRCRYVTEESIRIKKAVQALRSGDAIALGEQLNATHAGLRDDYEVSCPEIDFLQTFASVFDGVAGSRIMGGGFGGCTINLVREDRLTVFEFEIKAAFSAAFSITPSYFVSQIAQGTQLV